MNLFLFVIVTEHEKVAHDILQIRQTDDPSGFRINKSCMKSQAIENR